MPDGPQLTLKSKHADYPGIIPYSKGRTLFDRELLPEEKSVRGTLVTGLTREDIEVIDYFEGEVSDYGGSLEWIHDHHVNLKEYSRERVLVHPLESPTSLPKSSILTEKSVAPPAPSKLATPVKAQTYVYCDVSNLDAELWSFDDFVKDNAWKWI